MFRWKFDTLRGEVTISINFTKNGEKLQFNPGKVRGIIHSKRNDIRDKPSTHFRLDRSREKLLIQSNNKTRSRRFPRDFPARDRVLQRYLAARSFDILINNYLINFRLGIPLQFIASPEFIPWKKKKWRRYVKNSRQYFTIIRQSLPLIDFHFAPRQIPLMDPSFSPLSRLIRRVPRSVIPRCSTIVKFSHASPCYLEQQI